MSDEPEYLEIPAFLRDPKNLAEEHKPSDFTDLLSCCCKQKYSIEEHGKGYVIYWGRCQHKHGANIALLTECSRKDLIEYFEKSLNGEAR